MFTSGHQGEALSSLERESPDARGHWDTGDPQGHPEAGHVITKCDNSARYHLTLFADQ